MGDTGGRSGEWDEERCLSRWSEGVDEELGEVERVLVSTRSAGMADGGGGQAVVALRSPAPRCGAWEEHGRTGGVGEGGRFVPRAPVLRDRIRRRTAAVPCLVKKVVPFPLRVSTGAHDTGLPPVDGYGQVCWGATKRAHFACGGVAWTRCRAAEQVPTRRIFAGFLVFILHSNAFHGVEMGGLFRIAMLQPPALVSLDRRRRRWRLSSHHVLLVSCSHTSDMTTSIATQGHRHRLVHNYYHSLFPNRIMKPR